MVEFECSNVRVADHSNDVNTEANAYELNYRILLKNRCLKWSGGLRNRIQNTKKNCLGTVLTIAFVINGFKTYGDGSELQRFSKL